MPEEVEGMIAFLFLTNKLFNKGLMESKVEGVVVHQEILNNLD